MSTMHLSKSRKICPIKCKVMLKVLRDIDLIMITRFLDVEPQLTYSIRALKYNLFMYRI